MRRSSQLPSVDSDYSLNDDIGRRVERKIISDPYLRKDWEFADLERNYPMKPVMRSQRQDEMRTRAEDLNYRKMLLEEKTAELNEKKTLRELEMFESVANRENAIMEQIPLARKALAQIDPRDRDYLQKRMAVIEQYPMPFESGQFVDVIDKPMMQRHLRMREAKSESGAEVTKEEFEKSAMLLRDPQTIRLARANDQPSKILLMQAENTVKRYTQQIGFDPETNTFAPAEGAVVEDIADEEDSDMTAAMELLSRRPDLKEEINRRLTSVGKPPIQ